MTGIEMDADGGATLTVPLTVELSKENIEKLQAEARRLDTEVHGTPASAYTPDQAFVVVLNTGYTNILDASRHDGWCEGWFADPVTPWEAEA